MPRPTWVVPRPKSQVALRRTRDAARLAARLSARGVAPLSKVAAAAVTTTTAEVGAAVRVSGFSRARGRRRRRWGGACRDPRGSCRDTSPKSRRVGRKTPLGSPLASPPERTPGQMRAGERGRLFTVAHLWGGGGGGLSTQVLLLSRTVTQGASGLAGRLAALNASLRLGFRRNSEEFRNSTELKRHNKRTGKRQARHAIPPARRICTAVSACFPLAAFQLPAPCLLCGRLPHSTISRSSHVRYDATVTGQYRRFPMPNPPSPTGERTV